MTTLFISDLHLDNERPQVNELFLRFLREEAPGADALFILGDLFEAWIGDDDPSDLAAAVSEGLAALHDSGVPVYFMHGNRDFLLGRTYAARARMTLLPDPSVIVLDGQPVLLMHGDTLCTADERYQAFRAQTRDARWQAQFLAQPVAARIAFAQQARATSKAHQAGMQERMEALTDVSRDAVDELMTRFGIDTLIHGHTHRPAIHRFEVAGRERRRIVLGDWYDQGSVLRVKDGTFDLQSLG